jgi:hypothetical protein
MFFETMKVRSHVSPSDYNHFANCNAIGSTDWQQPLILLHETSLYVKGCKLDKLSDTIQDLNETFLEHTISRVLIAAARYNIYAQGDTWLYALMKTLAVGSSIELDFESVPTAALISRGFDELLHSFLHFIKHEIVQEMRSWTSSHRNRASNWWEAHADFGRLCDLDNQLPSREELDGFFSVLNALYPSQQNAGSNPIIEDKEYLEIFHNPKLPYLRRSALSCAFRAFVQTEHARMGLAPLSARPEDEIWIIKGAKVPFVLRRRPDDSYELIGEAYIHGIMQGELVEQGDPLDFRYIVLK